MHHVIYLPDAKTSDAKHLTSVGLADQVEGAQLTQIPGDRPVVDKHVGGVIVSWGRPPSAISRDPSALTWLPAMPLDGLPAERYFVGVDVARPPQPTELLKPHPLPGTPVELGGGLWTIPHAAELPFNIVRDFQTGEIQHEPQPKFEPFWRKCLAWRARFDEAKPGDPIPSMDEQVAFLEEALRLNYRVTPELITHLRLFQSGVLGTLRAMLAACLHVEPQG